MGAALKRRHGVLDRAVRRDEQDEGPRTDLEQAVEQGNAVDAGELDVAQGDVVPPFRGPFQRVLAGRAGAYGEALLLQVLREGVADEGFVVHDEDAGGRGASAGRGHRSSGAGRGTGLVRRYSHCTVGGR